MKQNSMKTKGFGILRGPEAEVSEPEPRAPLGKESDSQKDDAEGVPLRGPPPPPPQWFNSMEMARRNFSPTSVGEQILLTNNCW